MIVNSAMKRISAIAAGVLAAATLTSGALLPVSAVDCYPPGSCIVDTPVYADVPAIELNVGEANAQSCDVDGCRALVVTKSVNAASVRLAVEGVILTIAPLNTGGTARQVSASGDLVVTNSAGVKVTLKGLEPGSWVDIYINSTRTLIGKVQVGADGTVNATVPLPDGVATGSHTLQLAATNAAGTVISASLGVFVTPAKLSATAARYQVSSAKPGAVGSKSVKAGSVTQLSAGLSNALTGARLTTTQAKQLASCSATVTVKTTGGKVLLKTACLRFDTKTGRPALNWVVSSTYMGKAKVTFTFTEKGRNPSVRTQLFSIVK